MQERVYFRPAIDGLAGRDRSGIQTLETVRKLKYADSSLPN